MDTRRAGQRPCVVGDRLVEIPEEIPVDAGGVVLNVTVTGPKGPGYLVVHADGSPRPSTSSVNYVKGETVANAVTTAVGAGGVRIHASDGCPHVVVDLVGHYAPGDPALGGAFTASDPTRVVDTRKKAQRPCVNGGRLVPLPEAVPDEVAGVVLNVTVTGATAQGHLVVHADGVARPPTSSLNFVKGQTVANAVTTAVGPGGIRLYAPTGCPHVIVDLVGWFTGDVAVLDGAFTTGGPTRAIDTRRSAPKKCVTGERVVPMPDWVPDDASGVLLNVTVTAARGSGYVTVFADGTTRPTTSSVNFTKGATVPNAVTSAIGPGGVRVFASEACPHVIVDVVGYHLGEPPTLSGVVQIDAHMLRTCALIDDGTVRCWGSDGDDEDSFGSLGDGRHQWSAFPVPVVGVTNATSISLGELSTCAVLADATVTCWGYKQVGPASWTTQPPTEVPELDGVVQVAVGLVHACALMQDATVRCWGSEYMNGQKDELEVPAAVHDLDDVVEIVAANWHTCARHADGTVTCWGIGFGNDENDWELPAKVQIPDIEDAVQLSASLHGTCALEGDGSLWCWADLDPLVPEPPEEQVAIQPVELDVSPDIEDLGDGTTARCLVELGGSVVCFGSGPVRTWVDGEESGSPVTVPGLSGVTSVAIGLGHGCALLGDTTVRCWGSNTIGVLGDGTITDSATPVPVIAGIAP